MSAEWLRPLVTCGRCDGRVRLIRAGQGRVFACARCGISRDAWHVEKVVMVEWLALLDATRRRPVARLAPRRRRELLGRLASVRLMPSGLPVAISWHPRTER